MAHASVQSDLDSDDPGAELREYLRERILERHRREPGFGEERGQMVLGGLFFGHWPDALSIAGMITIVICRDQISIFVKNKLMRVAQS